ncbi:MAG: LPP20 family lipoprotein, partial [Spirochaetes bacterium]|nr:LPP20 family lipoprotein [Spirochaetota bacterium]
KNNISFLFLLFYFIFISFSLYSQSLASYQAAADDATRRLEEALSGGSAAGTKQTAAVKSTRGGTRPKWINNQYSDYPQKHYITAVGNAKNQSDAEKQALAALVAFFGQSVKSDYVVASLYSEAVTNGIVSVSENTNVRETIVTAASLDNLIGAAIGNVWEDGRGTFYALAYIEKERTVFIYTEIIRINQRNIENLISMNDSQKNTLDGYARYKLAALIAGMNAQYANIVSLAGGTTASLNMTSSDTLILEAADIIKNITVGFNVKKDSNNRVRDAFAKALSGEGLRTQGNNPPYILEINIDMSEAKFAGNSFIFCRYTLSANLVEKATGSVLFPFNVTDREGHTTYAEAQNRAFASIEKLINDKYPDAFREYLAALLPQKLHR